jgi:hypothetical protein
VTSAFQPPSQSAAGWAAIFSIWAASSGRVARQASAWARALLSGST